MCTRNVKGDGLWVGRRAEALHATAAYKRTCGRRSGTAHHACDGPGETAATTASGHASLERPRKLPLERPPHDVPILRLLWHGRARVLPGVG